MSEMTSASSAVGAGLSDIISGELAIDHPPGSRNLHSSGTTGERSMTTTDTTISTTVAARRVARVIDTRTQPGMGPGHTVRPVLEAGRWTEFDPFLLLMEDWFVPGIFGPHPHRGFETVTFVLEGEVRHEDNHGGRGVLRAGDAQFMTAGRGIVHAEEPATESAHVLQL